MKPSKKKPYVSPNESYAGDTPRGMLTMKLKKLGTAIEMKKGPKMNIDDHDYRWVDDKIRFLERDEIDLTKDDMERANELWRIYG